MENENLGDKVLRKIKEERIRPRPRWQFLLEDYFIWLFFLVSLILGAVAFCVALHIFFTNDWDLYIYLHTTLVGHVLNSIPFVWLAVLAVFILIAYYNFKYTKSGYRRETYFVVALSIAGSLILGVFLNSLGAGEKIEEAVAAEIPFYEKLTCCSMRKDVWSQPQSGLLGGQIMDVSGENFELKDFNGTPWQIKEDDDTLEYEPLHIKTGEQVKIIGEKKGDNVFWAREIRPWKNKGAVRKAKERLDD